jgi:hypothetical protein
MFANLITTIIFVLGLVTVSFSMFVAVEFYGARTRSPRADTSKLGSALGWQLVGEAIIGFGTLLFSLAAHFGWLEHWSVYTQSIIRFVMFAATAVTTYHLYCVICILKSR